MRDLFEHWEAPLQHTAVGAMTVTLMKWEESPAAILYPPHWCLSAQEHREAVFRGDRSIVQEAAVYEPVTLTACFCPLKELPWRPVKLLVWVRPPLHGGNPQVAMPSTALLLPHLGCWSAHLL